ncbi:MAG: site-2 protease family protein [Candidatus Omnitrophota bacterium]|nr:site-2 protease family protein [Candidatus Omnitrophota bacterium]
MKGAVRMFDVFGISIKIHWTFFILPLFAGYALTLQCGPGCGARAVFLILSLFFIVVCHELSHSLQAKKYGVRVKDITLLPIGGVASMESIPDNPRQEFAIAISGPLFNFILAAVVYLPVYFLLGREILFRIPVMENLQSWPGTFASIFWLNLILGIFNLLPAFPMDGGRIFRAFLAQQMNYLKATRIAVGFGHVFAVFFGFLGLWAGNWILVIIAFFIYTAASQEELQVEIKAALKAFWVKDIIAKDFLSVSPDDTMARVIEIMLHSRVEDFPVVEKGKIVGLLTRLDITRAIHYSGMNKRVKQVMRKEFKVVKPSDLLVTVHQLMHQSGLKAVPVLKDKKLYGIITLEDISKVYMIMSAKK